MENSADTATAVVDVITGQPNTSRCQRGQPDAERDPTTLLPIRAPAIPAGTASEHASTCADSHADADLAGSFSHGDEHDVHDSDAADQQRDTRNTAEQHRHDAVVACADSADVGQVADVKVVFLTRAMLCRWRELRRSASSASKVPAGSSAETYGCRKVFRRQQLFHRGGVRDQDCIVLILSPLRLPLAASTPITRNGRLRTRIVCPTGSAPANSSRTRSRPITATRAAVRTSASVKNSPDARPVANRQIWRARRLRLGCSSCCCRKPASQARHAGADGRYRRSVSQDRSRSSGVSVVLCPRRRARRPSSGYRPRR